MTGTEKQVKWATDIQAKFVNAVNQVVDELEQMTIQKRPDQAGFVPVLREKVNTVIAAELQNDSAAYWIEKYARFDKLDARSFLSPIVKSVKPA